MKDRLVYDCNVFLQFLLNPHGPGGRGVRLVFDRDVDLFLSPETLAELRDFPDKPFCAARGITDDLIEQLIESLAAVATLVDAVPERYRHPIDPDDSCYVNLAIAADARLIVSRDRHLLNLVNPDKPWALDFQRRFPQIGVLTPDEYLMDVERRRAKETGPG